jgi:hypothetical protein
VRSFRGRWWQADGGNTCPGRRWSPRASTSFTRPPRNPP